MMDRRRFLLAGGAALGSAVLAPVSASASASAAPLPTRRGPGPYGPLGPPDRNGIRLPSGFTSRIVARSEEIVPGTDHPWHRFPDGGATFRVTGGGWVYVSNSEVPLAGEVGALRFDPQGRVIDAYRILTGTSMNCAGGPTPWGTWLSCEEHPVGQVWECDPTRPGQGVRRPALGTFAHEAVAVDPVRRQLYLTEDDGTDGGDGFYRFTPRRYPDLSDGMLEAAQLGPGGLITWRPVDPLVPMRAQRMAGAATAFDGAEGIWYQRGHVRFATKVDNRIWDLDVAAQRMSVLYDGTWFGSTPPLSGVDNLVMSRGDDLYVAEDGGSMRLVVITKARVVAPVLQVTAQDSSEIAGPAFDPAGRRLYFSSQRGGATGAGLTYEVTGPFRQG